MSSFVNSSEILSLTVEISTASLNIHSKECIQVMIKKARSPLNRNLQSKATSSCEVEPIEEKGFAEITNTISQLEVELATNSGFRSLTQPQHVSFAESSFIKNSLPTDFVKLQVAMAYLWRNSMHLYLLQDWGYAK